MRRKEFEVKDRNRIDEVLKTTEIGYLAFNGPDGWTRITPLNFVYDGRVLWHGPVGGERFEGLKQDSRATFTAVSLQRYIPSHYLSEENATSATAAFKSVVVRGHCRFIEDPEEKCAVLNQLMEKYQPEGRFKKVTPDDPLYAKVLKATGIYALMVENISAKFKFAQNKSKEDPASHCLQIKRKRIAPGPAGGRRDLLITFQSTVRPTVPGVSVAPITATLRGAKKAPSARRPERVTSLTGSSAGGTAPGAACLVLGDGVWGFLILRPR